MFFHVGRIEDQNFDVYHHGHRDFEDEFKLRIPTLYCADVHEAVLSILERELPAADLANNNKPKNTMTKRHIDSAPQKPVESAP